MGRFYNLDKRIMVLRRILKRYYEYCNKFEYKKASDELEKFFRLLGKNILEFWD
jgi:hypothetical protein